MTVNYQTNLFDLISAKSMFRPTDPSTSRIAAVSQLPKLGETLSKVHNFISMSGGTGVTDEQIAMALSMKESSASKRRGDLVKLGLVKDSGTVKPTSTGRNAIVWCISEETV